MKRNIRDSLAYCCRSLPYFKGKYRIGPAVIPRLTNYENEQDCLVTIKMQDSTTFVLDLRSSLEQKVFFAGEHDYEIIQMLSRILDPGAVVFDVGANIGLYSIALGEKLKRISENPQLWSFEPIASNFQRLVNLVEINKLTNIVYPVNSALGKSEGTIQLCMVDKKFGSSTGNAFCLGEGLVKLEEPNFSAPITKLDEFVKQKNIQRCDIIKVDIEGAEMDFILGGINFIQEHRPVIYGEFEPFWSNHFGYSFVDVADIFIPWEYKIYQQKNRKTFIEVKEIRAGISDVLMIPAEKLTAISKRLNSIHS